MSRAYRALPPSQLAGDAVIPRIGVTVAFRECVLRYLPPTLDEKQRSGYLRLLGLLLVWLRPDPKFDGRFRIYREQVVACLDCKELAERHKKSFSAKRDVTSGDGHRTDLARAKRDPEERPAERITADHDGRGSEPCTLASAAALSPGNDLVELVGEKRSAQHDLREMEARNRLRARRRRPQGGRLPTPCCLCIRTSETQNCSVARA